MPDDDRGPSFWQSDSATIRGTFHYDFDAGVESNVGADVWWEQETQTARAMVPQGEVRLVNLGNVDFASISLTDLEHAAFSNNPIDGNDDSSNELVGGDVFGVLTDRGNYAKVQVVQYGYDLVVRFITYAP
jgi:hypothetical protein